MFSNTGIGWILTQPRKTATPSTHTVPPIPGEAVKNAGDPLDRGVSVGVMESGNPSSPDFENIKKKLLEEFKDVFKEELSPSDRINGIQRIEIDDSNIKPLHWTTPKEIPCHLRKAADKELKRCLKAGQIEPCTHWTKWLSRGMFVGKAVKEGEEVRARLVSDFRVLNKALKRPNYPIEGSSQLIKQVNPRHRFWITLDFTSGYHQCALHEDDRDYFSIILPQGKFRYAVHPQGASSLSDFFLIPH